MNFLNLEGKTFLVVGFANRKSIAWASSQSLIEAGAKVIFSVRSKKRKEELLDLVPDAKVFTCDFEIKDEIMNLGRSLKDTPGGIDGVLHSIAFANYSDGFKPFHDTDRADFLQAVQISSFSLVELAHACKQILSPNASVVTVGISSVEVTAENYGYMSPIKASLEANVRYLAKSFSAFSNVRFNCVNAGPLKTSASAGIPGYLVNYLFAEKLTFRKKALDTQEVANLILFLLSERSSGINGQGIVIDAGMGLNYFDGEIVKSAMQVKQ